MVAMLVASSAVSYAIREADALRVHVVTEGADPHEAKALRGAIVDAVSYWRDEGHNVRLDEKDPHVVISTVKDIGSKSSDWAGNVLLISMGSECDEEWTPYSHEAVYRIAQMRLGGVLGEDYVWDDPEHPMSLNFPRDHAKPCRVASDQELVVRGYDRERVNLHIWRESSLHVEINVQRGSLDLCVEPHDPAYTRLPGYPNPVPPGTIKAPEVCRPIGPHSDYVPTYHVPDYGAMLKFNCITSDACVVSYAAYATPTDQSWVAQV